MIKSLDTFKFYFRLYFVHVFTKLLQSFALFLIFSLLVHWMFLFNYTFAVIG